MLGVGDKSNYMEIIENKHAEIENANKENNKVFMSDIKKIDPEGYKLLKSQDKQIEAVQAADAKYAADKDLDWIISFWKKIWDAGGPTFEGSGWMFRLPDLYIKAKRYDDALIIVQKIKNTKNSYYSSKAENYIAKIMDRKAKDAAKANK